MDVSWSVILGPKASHCVTSLSDLLHVQYHVFMSISTPNLPNFHAENLSHLPSTASGLGGEEVGVGWWMDERMRVVKTDKLSGWGERNVSPVQECASPLSRFSPFPTWLRRLAPPAESGVDVEPKLRISSPFPPGAVPPPHTYHPPTSSTPSSHSSPALALRSLSRAAPNVGSRDLSRGGEKRLAFWNVVC